MSYPPYSSNSDAEVSPWSHETLCPTNFIFYLAFEIYGNWKKGKGGA
jgi:hypothetical protein